MIIKNVNLLLSQIGALLIFVTGIVVYVMTTSQEAAICFSIATAICGFVNLQIYKTNQALRSQIDLQGYEHPALTAMLLFIAFVFAFLGVQTQNKDISPSLLSLQNAFVPIICMVTDMNLHKLHYLRQFEYMSSLPILLACLPLWIFIVLLTGNLDWSDPTRLCLYGYCIGSILVEISYLFRTSTHSRVKN